jgi:hypothetical protein
MKNEKTPFGFLIAGALIGAALGAVIPEVVERPFSVAAGSVLGVFCGMIAERYAPRLTKVDALLIGIIVAIAILLLLGPQTYQAYRE